MSFLKDDYDAVKPRGKLPTWTMETWIEKSLNIFFLVEDIFTMI